MNTRYRSSNQSIRFGRRAILFLVVLAALQVLKLALAREMNLFGDEAFYWLESSHLALAYSDLPGMTAWLIRLSTAWFGEHYLGVRAVFLALGALTPVLVYALAREFHTARLAWLAAGASLTIPLVALAGVLAIPDVPLNVLGLALALALVRSIKTGRPGWWAVAGVVTALGFTTHYRFAVPALAAILMMLFEPRLRGEFRKPGPWLAATIALLGLLPLVLFNLDAEFAGLRFQLSDRHPWSFQFEGLLQPVQQAVITTPLIYILLLVTGWVAIGRNRTDGGSWSVITWLGVFPPVFYFLVGLWADQDRTTFHWPVVGYLVLIVALPEALTQCRAWLRGRDGMVNPLLIVSLAIGLAVSVAGPVYLLGFVRDVDRRISVSEFFPDNAMGWSAVAADVKVLHDNEPDTTILVADNFMLAAELRFELGGPDVVSLDHPLNHFHGRAPQLRLWGLDEDSIASDRHLLLVIEETALDLDERPAWVRRLCDRFGSVEFLGESVLYGGRMRFAHFRVKPDGQACELPSFAYLDEPVPESTVSGLTRVTGWAFRDESGVDGVEVLIDGKAIAVARYGIENPGVLAFFPGSTDPNHPRVGFEVDIDLAGMAPGWHELSLRTHGKGGFVRDHRFIRVNVE